MAKGTSTVDGDQLHLKRLKKMVSLTPYNDAAHGEAVPFAAPFEHHVDEIFHDVILKDEKTLFHDIVAFLTASGYEVTVNEKFYAIAKGKNPIVLNAHVDTVFKNPPANPMVSTRSRLVFNSESRNSYESVGLGADDRAGIAIIIYLVELGHRPHVIITREEEHGGRGVNAMLKDVDKPPFSIKYVIGLDRHGVNDCVFYNQKNADFAKYISKAFGFVQQRGSMADISFIGPKWNVACVNLSVGYENAHQTIEVQSLDVLRETAARVATMLEHQPDDGFAYSGGYDIVTTEGIIKMKPELIPTRSLISIGATEEKAAELVGVQNRIVSGLPFIWFDFRRWEIMAYFDYGNGPEPARERFGKVMAQQVFGGIRDKDLTELAASLLGEMVSLGSELDVLEKAHAKDAERAEQKRMDEEKAKRAEQELKYKADMAKKAERLKDFAGHFVVNWTEARMVLEDAGARSKFISKDALEKRGLTREESLTFRELEGEIAHRVNFMKFDFINMKAWYASAERKPVEIGLGISSFVENRVFDFIAASTGTGNVKPLADMINEIVALNKPKVKGTTKGGSCKPGAGSKEEKLVLLSKLFLMNMAEAEHIIETNGAKNVYERESKMEARGFTEQDMLSFKSASKELAENIRYMNFHFNTMVAYYVDVDRNLAEVNLSVFSFNNWQLFDLIEFFHNKRFRNRVEDLIEELEQLKRIEN